MSEISCPICQNKIDFEKLTIKKETLEWLCQLKENEILEPWLFYSKTIHEQALKGTTTQLVAENMKIFEERIIQTTRVELGKFSESLGTIATGITEKISKPKEIGTGAELIALDKLEDACAGDVINRLGGKGEPDILAKPYHKGAEIGQTIIIEIKKTSRWSNEYLEEVEKFMGDYNTPFGILATEKLPAEAEITGFSVSCGDRGIILVTRLDYAALAYQILRKLLVALYLEGKEVTDFRALFKDEELLACLTQAKEYTKYVRSMRTHLRNIEKDLEEMQNQLDKSIDTVLHKVAAFQET
ncbi:MAG TPA: DUF2130 domain-containing protein [Candidatus Bathyarchaeia archaeon]|nr:DUF2130 domain-containing protein [Candidatus Bathyarchaeia archaeon]